MIQYTVAFYTEDVVDGMPDDIHCIKEYSAPTPLPIPTAGTTVLIEGELYDVKYTVIGYPEDGNNVFTTEVYVEVTR